MHTCGKFPRLSSRICSRVNRILVLLLLGLSALAGSNGLSEELPAPIEVDLKRIFAGEAPTSLDELRAMEAHQQTLAEKLIGCTVGLRIGQAHGSGVIVREDGIVLTAAHVAEKPGRAAEVILPDGRRVKGTTLGIYRTLDAGLLKIEGDGPWPFAEMAGREPVKEGQWCIATGHPGGYQPGRKPVVRVGRVLITGKFAITTDCTLIGGDSGGPLFDMDGRVIGINSRIGRFLEANLHVPITAYYAEWERLSKGESWGHFPDDGRGPYIGVQGEAGADVVRIRAVSEGAPAAEAGIEAGDVIVKFDGREIADFESLQQLVNDHRPGDEVAVVVRRGEETKELNLKIGRRP